MLGNLMHFQTDLCVKDISFVFNKYSSLLLWLNLDIMF